MRVTWAHPSWRDLVIDTLVRDAEERRRFLAACGVDGAALALSVGGGASGGRRLPLLTSDADWDALGDGLYRLCPELDDQGAARLLSVLMETDPGAERDALAALVLERLRAQWNGRTVDVEALAGWLTLAAQLAEAPERPSLAATWAELEPLECPSTPAGVERLSDWLRLVELLSEHDPELLARLGFPERQRKVLDAFAAQFGEDEPPQERELRAAALERLAWLDPQWEVNARLTATALAQEEPSAEWLPPESTGFSVERVLRDLD